MHSSLHTVSFNSYIKAGVVVVLKYDILFENIIKLTILALTQQTYCSLPTQCQHGYLMYRPQTSIRNCACCTAVCSISQFTWVQAMWIQAISKWLGSFKQHKGVWLWMVCAVLKLHFYTLNSVLGWSSSRKVTQTSATSMTQVFFQHRKNIRMIFLFSVSIHNSECEQSNINWPIIKFLFI